MNTLYHRWLNLAGKLNASLEAVEQLYKNLEKAYSSADRHYHNLSHLEFMFAEIDRENIAEPAIEFATWYHDIVYKPGSKRNERKSADIAREALLTLGADRILIDKVENMIMATRGHTVDPGDETTALFLDVDIAILGAEPEVYRRYADAIRKEFRWLPDSAYQKGRAEFLASLRQRSTIFLTPGFHARHEKRARKNIDMELATLKRA